MPVPLGSLARVLATAALRGTVDPVGRLGWRVRLRYIDVNLHMNYASYLEVMELARWDWAVRTGQHRWWYREGIRPLVGSVTVDYRRELRPLAKFVVETRATGFDRRALVVEQCFVGPSGTIHARATLNLVFRRGPTVLDREALEALTGPLVVPPRA